TRCANVAASAAANTSIAAQMPSFPMFTTSLPACRPTLTMPWRECPIRNGRGKLQREGFRRPRSFAVVGGLGEIAQGDHADQALLPGQDREAPDLGIAHHLRGAVEIVIFVTEQHFAAHHLA